MKTVLLKNVAEEDWRSFKSEAATHNMKMPEFFSYILKEHKEKKHRDLKKRWERILGWRSGRTKAEIAEHEKRMNEFRHRFKMER